jgi:hypothetical protein
MTASDDEIDRLYQLPLPEFTAARDALAKRAGNEAADVKRLQKPNAAAWAVNQLYWRRRKTFDQLIRASERLRAAHAQRLSGKPTDVAPAEGVHRAALKAAVEEARGLLGEAGDASSPATINAVTETLQLLPSAAASGRLTRPLKPAGFEALAGLLGPRGKTTVRRLADVVPIESAKRSLTLSKAEQAKREADARRREIADVQRRLAAAKTSQRKADQTLARARQALERAVQERARLEAALEQATARVQHLRDDVNRDLKRSKDAAAEHERLDQRLADLQSKNL